MNNMNIIITRNGIVDLKLILGAMQKEVIIHEKQNIIVFSIENCKIGKNTKFAVNSDTS
jgi:hypothetical protein